MHIGIAGPAQIKYLAHKLINDNECVFEGLPGTSVTRLVLGLWKKGHKISLFTLDKKLCPGEMEILSGERLKVYIGPYRQNHRMRDFFKEERLTLLKAMRMDDAPIINPHWSYEYAMAAIESGKPHIISCRDEPLTILKYSPDLYRFGRLLMAWWVFRNGSSFIANSPYLAEALRFWGVEPSHVIPNFIDEDWFLNKHTREKSDSLRMISINNGWSKRKNMKTALKAFKIIKTKFPTIEYDLYGIDYGPGERAEQWARAKGFDEGVNFIGSTPGEFLRDKLSTYHLLLHPAKEESFGNILIEAMASKVPIVAGRNSGAVIWVLDGGKAGFLVDVNNPNDIANVVNHVLSDFKLKKDLVDLGYQRVMNVFSSEIVVAQYEQVYKSLLLKKKAIII